MRRSMLTAVCLFDGCRVMALAVQFFVNGLTDLGVIAKQVAS